LTALKSWLYQGAVEKEPRHQLPIQASGEATLRGQSIRATPEEIVSLAREALAEGHGKPDNFQSWYTLVDGHRVSTKWLASLLSGLAVAEFQASEARRVLRQLGVTVYHDA
jgi:hypothetical protein